MSTLDISMDVMRPAASHVKYVGASEDGQSYQLKIVNVTGPDAYSWAGLTSGAYPWLGHFGDMLPVERYDPGDEIRWRYIPNASAFL